jgi:hypothetical protein
MSNFYSCNNLVYVNYISNNIANNNIGNIGAKYLSKIKFPKL